MNWLLNDEEIRQVVDTGDFPGVEIEWQSARDIAKAQLRKVMRLLTKPPFEDITFLPFLIFGVRRSEWEQLSKEAGLE